MNILVAPDSFKECLRAEEVAAAIAAGWQEVRATDNVVLAPIADGGEGTVSAMLAAIGGMEQHAEVTGPLGDRVSARYGVSNDGKTVIIEMAAASGLALVSPARREVARATSRGTGELLLHAACVPEAERIVVGLGGSATNDGGAGFAQALGYRFLGAEGVELPAGGAALAQLTKIDAPELPERFPRIVVACDVVNPLCGLHGASHVFGPQKGATSDEVEVLDAALRHYAEVVEDFTGRACQLTPGAGAAGGLGFALLSFTEAELRPGFGVVAEVTGLARKVAACDLIITGEGRVDAQSLMGKAVGGVLELARRHGKPMAILAGDLGPGHETLRTPGVHSLTQIGPPKANAEARKTHAAQYLRDAAARLAGHHA